MLSDFRLIKLLADGEFHSGEDIGRILGVSRAAIWKKISNLEEYGLAVERVRGRGYKLEKPIDLLCEKDIAPNISVGVEKRLCFRLASETVSTNEDAFDLLCSGIPDPVIVTAEFQRKGRGRRGRRWVSPYGSGVLLSLGWRVQSNLRLDGLSLVIGLVIAEVLEDIGVKRVRLKWPNDLYVGDKKLGGILVELQGGMGEDALVVAGMGINGALPATSSYEIDQPYTDISSSTNARWSRNELIVSIVKALTTAMDQFVFYGFEFFAERWARYDLCAGRSLRVQTGDCIKQGTGRGVSRSGALLLESCDGVCDEIVGGEVSVRFE